MKNRRLQKIMEYKTIVADQVKEKGQIIVPELEEAVFKDNEQAAVLYQEVAEQRRFQRYRFMSARRQSVNLARSRNW